MRYSIAVCTILVIAGVLGAAEGDFDRGEAAYEQGAYRSAEVFFQNILREDPHHAHVPDAIFYLVNIHQYRGNIPAFLAWAQRFLNECPYDKRRQDVFTRVIQKLIERSAHTLACEFIEQYDFFVIDQKTLEDIGFGLLQQNELELADSVFALCVPSDTIHILRARLADTDEKRRHYYELVGGAKGSLYIIEMLLAQGDTLQAFDMFRTVDRENIRDDVLIRYAPVALLYDKVYFTALCERLEQMPEYRQKAVLLKALLDGTFDRSIIPQDYHECSLYVAAMQQDTFQQEAIPGFPGDSIALDSILVMKSQYGSHFVLDSLHAERLLMLGDTTTASRMIAPYVGYVNTSRYARIIQGMELFNKNDYRRAATHFILAEVEEPHVRFMLAQALTRLGMDAEYLYEEVLHVAQPQDTILRAAATRELIERQYTRGAYDRVIAYDPNMFMVGSDDAWVLGLYTRSLARMGELERADMVYSEFIQDTYDHDVLMSDYGEYLIEAKNFKKARVYYDSLVQATGRSPIFLYNWALVPFMQGAVDTAQARFTFLLENYPGSEDYQRAAFKLATMLYLEEQFDSAAVLYGTAREDSTLARDALRNQLICYKKSGSWFKVVKTGQEILAAELYEEEHETRFDIGYAWLRAGRPERAVEHLLTASRTHPSPEYYYWLAEAYLARADFGNALYFYRMIVDVFPGDEMWTPTAWYKTGIVLEFMDAEDEAKAVYRHIIKTRGAADTWGVEARRRIEYMEQ
ncbi:MAG: tetratricopeptide repeat protein [candidate division WOR-3 bacterium]|nr:MAG: tetratricopeptide repeat protein [candidate division WOR-3 bacterium]